LINTKDVKTGIVTLYFSKEEAKEEFIKNIDKETLERFSIMLEEIKDLS